MPDVYGSMNIKVLYILFLVFYSHGLAKWSKGLFDNLTAEGFNLHQLKTAFAKGAVLAVTLSRL